MLNKLEFLVPLLIGRFQLDPNDEKLLEKTKEPAQRVVRTLFDIRAERNYRMTEEDTKKIERILNKCANDLEGVMQKMRVKNIAKKNSKLKSAGLRTV